MLFVLLRLGDEVEECRYDHRLHGALSVSRGLTCPELLGLLGDAPGPSKSAANGVDMKIAVVGATGATGRRVVEHALAQGHFVTAVARHPERLSSADRLTFVRGDVLSPGGLAGALDGVEAVVSCIGPEKNLSPGTVMSVGVASILAECKRANVRRFILQSGIGLSDGRELSFLNRLVVRVSRRIFTAAVIDKAVAERMTQKIGIEWVIVRPVVLADKPAKGRYTAGPSARVAPLVPFSFDDCADCLLHAATDESNWIGTIVNVGS